MGSLYPESGRKRKKDREAREGAMDREVPGHRSQCGRAGNTAGQASSVIQKKTSVRSMTRIRPVPPIASRMLVLVIC
jgi:hypothetical protein